MGMFEKLIEKKKKEGKVPSEMESQAKGSVLSDLMSQLSDMGMDKVKGIKKVTVAAPDKSGLAEGLAKAKAMLGHDDSDESDEDPKEEAMESPGEEASEEGDEHEGMFGSSEHEDSEEPSKEELLAELAKIQAQIEKLKA
jgi:hypothetical protein